VAVGKNTTPWAWVAEANGDGSASAVFVGPVVGEGLGIEVFVTVGAAAVCV
jgi:hypothetical protein